MAEAVSHEKAASGWPEERLPVTWELWITSLLGSWLGGAFVERMVNAALD